ncbi:MAG TPA: malonyl-CoA decarboxylase [Beijerinckiaceae bacterium]|nr:malonyl-CoA decarboxylase [Beijerinckiaceae bacterium]
MASAFFSDLLSSIADRTRMLLRRREWNVDPAQRAASLVELSDALVSGRGEASGMALAAEILDRYQELDADARLTFFEALAEKFGPDEERLHKAVEAWQRSPGADRSADLHFVSEPRRQEFFRRLNRAPGATAALVRMRADLIALRGSHPALMPVDRDLAHLLASWFNRGFLVLRRIDWSTPAIVLEKIIRYEAVHEIHDWEDLRRRIDPQDRRCYAFFHPALVDEPLIFVEVALTEDMPSAIAPLLAADRTPTLIARARTATFYSISNCQRGLRGISFGSFLIKQVVEELQRELPKLETFVTLSPAPEFTVWLTSHPNLLSPEDVVRLENPDGRWADDVEEANRLRRVIEPLAADYFLRAKTDDGRPVDPVARFHLGNGARLERLNWLGDSSPRAMRESAGLMVNYLYDLDEIEKNHEAYANQGEIIAANAVRRLLRIEARPRLLSAAPGASQT